MIVNCPAQITALPKEHPVTHLLCQRYVASCSIILGVALAGTAYGQSTGVQRGAAGQTYNASGTPSTVLFDNTPVNVGGYATSASTIGTAQDSGLHTVAGNLTAYAPTLSSSSDAVVDLYVLVNGNAVSRTEHTLSGGTYHSLPFNTLANLNPGDVVSLQINPLFGVPIHVSGGSYSHASLSFTPVPEPAGILAMCSLVCAGGVLYRRYVKRRDIA